MRRLRWYLLLPTIPVVIAVAAAVLAPWVAPYSPTSTLALIPTARR